MRRLLVFLLTAFILVSCAGEVKEEEQRETDLPSALGAGVAIPGTSTSTFTLDDDNTSTPGDMAFVYNRGSEADVQIGWDETNDQFEVNADFVAEKAFATSNIVTFADEDATPSVANASVFKTANTTSTAITMFDDGKTGQRIEVIIGDSYTTIDFTGTNLKGNDGADWSPDQNDRLSGTYDGTYWYCDVGMTTSDAGGDPSGTSSTTFTIDDDNIGSPTDMSLVFNRGTSSDVQLGWNETNDQFEFNDDLVAEKAFAMSNIVTFSDEDATPSVIDANIFKTANTAATTITMFDGGKTGQGICVIINDDYTTIDFTGTNLKGNDGVDWSPGTGDVMFANFDGTYWYCDVGLTTSDVGGGGTGDDIDVTTSDASSSPQSVDLPTAVGKDDDLYVIIKTDGTNNTVTVNTNGSETIDGASKYILRRKYEVLAIVSNNANWFTISHHGQETVNVQDFGAVGDGTANDTTKIQAAINAATEGDCVFFPEGDYKIDAPLTVTKRLWLLGTGLKTQIYQSSDADLFQFTNWHGGRIEGLCLGSAATTAGKALMLMTQCHYSMIQQIWMKGSYYGIYLKGCMGTQIYFPSYIGTGFFGSCSTNQWWIYGERYGYSINATHIFSAVFQGNTGGIKIIDTNNEGGVAIHGAIIEGMSGHGVYLSGIKEYVSIEGLHLEDSNAGIELVNCSNGSIRDCYVMSTMGIDLDMCSQITIQGGYHSYIRVDDYSHNININNIMIEDGGVITGGPLVNVSNIKDTGAIFESWRAKGILPSKGGQNLCDGILNKWTGSVPMGFTAYPNACVSKESSIVKFGNYSAKVEVQAASTVAALQYDLPYDRVAKSFIKNRRSAAYKWTQSPSQSTEYYCELSGGGNPDLRLQPRAVYINNSPADEGSMGSLSVGQYDYGDNDSLGYNTIYVRITGDGDPDSQASGYIKSQYAMQPLSIRAWVYKPSGNGVNPTITVKYPGPSETTSGTFSVPVDEWTPITVTFNLSPNSTAVSVMLYARISGGAPGELCYFDGIEIVEGYIESPIYNDSRGIDGNFSLSGSFIRSGEVGTMTGDETFTLGDGNIFIKDPGGNNRTFNPSGTFPALTEIVVINTADASENISFDSTGLNETIGQNQRGWFVFDGSNWRKIYVGS